jgi:hypothetical protein
MGKNFSKGNSGKRKESDFYATPKSLTREFLKATRLEWYNDCIVSDPCAGTNAIVDVLKEQGFHTNSHDINTDGVDFLKDDTKVDYIITNPPYSLANEFILHAKEVVKRKFAMLLPITYLQGSYRYNNIWLDKEFQLQSLYVFNRFPMLEDTVREDGKFSTGMSCYAWYVWDRFWVGKPEINWLDVDKYVLKKGDLSEHI